jgi:hypothetical protein
MPSCGYSIGINRTMIARQNWLSSTTPAEFAHIICRLVIPWLQVWNGNWTKRWVWVFNTTAKPMWDTASVIRISVLRLPAADSQFTGSFWSNKQNFLKYDFTIILVVVYSFASLVALTFYWPNVCFPLTEISAEASFGTGWKQNPFNGYSEGIVACNLTE